MEETALQGGALTIEIDESEGEQIAPIVFGNFKQFESLHEISITKFHKISIFLKFSLKFAEIFEFSLFFLNFHEIYLIPH